MVSHKITVLHVLNMNPDKHGVLEMQMLEMAQQLTNMNWRQIVIFNNEPQQWMKEWSDRTGGIMLSVPDPSGSGALQVAQIAREYNVDLVHIHFITGRTLLIALRNAGCYNVVATIHSFRKPQKFELARQIYKHFNTIHVKHFIAVSNYIYHQACREFLLAKHRITVVYNGINTEYYKPRDDKYELRKSMFGIESDAPMISIISHLSPGKRLNMLIQAMPTVLQHMPNAQLVIAGGGSERQRLEALINELELSNNARVISSDNKTELIYAASDISVLPSQGEGLPGNAIEAMACGLPLVATPCGGLAEVAENGVSGIFVTNQTAIGLAEAIIPLLQNKDQRVRMGNAARSRVEKLFDVRNTASSTISIYRTIIEK